MSVDLQYLSCLSSSRSSTDKLAFDVGLQEDKEGIIIDDQFSVFCGGDWSIKFVNSVIL